MDYSIILKYPEYSWDFNSISSNQRKYLTNQVLVSMSRTEKRTTNMKEELLAVTWHPDRVMNWCIDIQEIDTIRNVFI